ncbi:hypothetical protein KEM56_002541 [Ascosphaera pollenicola]|nr:hypothetical protein KEM56_002541 [Ascosphaera pollenicola]
MSAPSFADSILAPWSKAISNDPDLEVAHGYSGSIGLHATSSRNDRIRYPLNTDSLISSSEVCSLSSGTGIELFNATVLPCVEAAEHEVILVTCFWAASPTREALKRSLKRLSDKAVQQRREGTRDVPIRVRICFSSLSLSQKLFHTSDLRGRLYHAFQFKRKLGLPSPEELLGLDIKAKSLFVRPLSVMHSKFVIIDRETVLLPSCNVSWEEWYEGCLRLDGPIVSQVWRFWKGVWNFEDDDSAEDYEDGDVRQSGMAAPVNITDSVQTILLPSTHHSSWRYSFWPWSTPSAPVTPLNAFIIDVLRAAKHDIFIQTPNLTSQPVLDALLESLQRGVNVTIVSNKCMMLLEQLVTAGRTTNSCLKSFNESYLKLVRTQITAFEDHPSGVDDDLERGRSQSMLGSLSIFYWHSDKNPKVSHLKLTIIDEDVCVLGSGNMDRASWFTSQELGVAFFSREVVANVRKEFVDTAKANHRPALM